MKHEFDYYKTVGEEEVAIPVLKERKGTMATTFSLSMETLMILLLLAFIIGLLVGIKATGRSGYR